MKTEEAPQTTEERLNAYDQMESGRAREREAKAILKLAEFSPTQQTPKNSSRASIALWSLVDRIDAIFNPTPQGAISAAENQLMRKRTRKRLEKTLPKN